MTITDPEAHELAVVCAQVADAEHGSNIVVLEVGDVLGIAEYFVVISASNRRLVRSIVDRVEEGGKELLDRSPRRLEGAGEQQWVLVDYGDVVVHVFLAEIREFYDIERLYTDVPRIEWRPNEDVPR
jgi:ribosome-associated protein